MKRLFSSLALFVAVLAGCKSHQPVVSCNVDPDVIFGQHYTAADFQIWEMVPNSEVDQMILGSKLPDCIFYSSNDMFDNILVKECDTALVAAVLRPLCRQRGWHLLWGSWKYDDEPTEYQALYFHIKPLVDGTSVNDARVETVRDKPSVFFHFDEKYHADWKRITRDNIGFRLSFKLGDRVLMTPMVNGEITGGAAAINGDFTEEECCALVTILLRKN